VEPEFLRGKQLAALDTNELTCQNNQANICTENGTFCPFNCTCEDKIIRCSNRQLTEFPQVPLDTVELFLDNNHITELPPAILNNLVNLVKLDLSQNSLSYIESDTFRGLSKLSTLILSYNQLKCLGDRAFVGLTGLRILSLHGNDLSTLPAFSSLTNISHIALGSNQVSAQFFHE
jgi:slit protein 2